MFYTDDIQNKYCLISLFGKPVLFSNDRFPKRECPLNSYCYDVKYDNNGNISKIKDIVMFDYRGSILCLEKIEPITKRGNIYTTRNGIDISRDDYKVIQSSYSITDYIKNYDQLLNDIK